MQVHPTLLIGLGGTGKEVLLRIRRLFYESGCTDQPPWVAYLWIDTAIKAETKTYIKMRGNVEHPKDEVARCTRFKTIDEDVHADEVVDIGVPFNRVVNPNDVTIEAIKNPSKRGLFKNIWEWMDEGLLRQVDANGLEQGAKQLPPLGRLALFANAPKVIAAIDHSMAKLNATLVTTKIREAIEKRQLPPLAPNEQINVTNGIRVILVGSLAGGTGAGCCVDIAAMLKAQNQVFRGMNVIPEVWGCFLMPSAFERDPQILNHANIPQMMKNGYAMAQEIESFSLARQGSGNFLTGRDRTGVLRASWLYPSAPENAPEIEAPIYHTCMYFDGHGTDTTAYRDITDNYAMIAHLLYTGLQDSGLNDQIVLRTTNVTYRNLFAHTECYPPGPSQNATWCDQFSFRYAAAGISRVSFERPRLCLMAAYTLASKALHSWLGEPNPRLQPKNPAMKTELEERAVNLRASTLQRLRLEYESRWTDQLTPWTSVLSQRHPWPKYEEVMKADARETHADFYDALRFEKIPVIDAAACAAEYSKYFLTGDFPHIQTLLADLVNKAPLEGISVAEANKYVDQGGLAAVDYLIEPESGAQTPVMLATLNALAVENDNLAATAATNERNGLIYLDEVLNRLKRAESAKQKADTYILVKSSTKDQLAADVLELSIETLKRAKAWMRYRYEALIRGTFTAMLKDLLARKQAFDDVARAWRERVQKGRTFLNKLLTQPAHEYHPCGVDEILKELRNIPTTGVTNQLRRDIQTDEGVLWSEIKTAYRDDMTRIRRDWRTLQSNLLKKWRDMLYTPGGTNPGLPLERFIHLVDLATFPRLAELSFDKQIEALVSDARSYAGVTELLKNNIEPLTVASHLGDPANMNRLRGLLSQFRAELRPSNERRNSEVLFTAQGYPPQVNEHVFSVGPQGLPGVDHPTNDPFEAYVVRHEFDMPPPAFLALQHSAPLGTAADSRILHFIEPKDGYGSIHAWKGPEVEDTIRRNKTAVLAMILGQLRPGDRDDSAKEFHFFVDPQDGSIPLGLTSLPSIIAALGDKGDCVSYLSAMESRNRELMADLSPVVRVALRLILDYNLKVVAAKSEILLDANPAGNNGNQPVRRIGQPTVTPQSIILNSIKKDLSVALPGEAAARFDDENRIRDLLKHFIHHFAKFVPVNLNLKNSPRLLVLNARVRRYRVEAGNDPENDLLLRKDPHGYESEIFQRLGMNSPWQLYNERTGRDTLTFHDLLSGRTGKSMCPPINAEQFLDRPEGWDENYLTAAGALADLYRELFKRPKLLMTDEEAESFNTRRKAAAKSS